MHYAQIDAADETIELVVRVMPAVYSRFYIQILDGPPSAQIDVRSAHLSYPDPHDKTGRLSEECCLWLLNAVAQASAALNLPMCVVFGRRDSIFAEPDGTMRYSDSPPRGGLPLNSLLEPLK